MLRTTPECLLFSDAKPAKYDTQQIVGREFASNFAERLLRQAEFFGEQLKRRQGAFNDISRRCNMFLRRSQSTQVALTGNEDIFCLMPSSDVQQFLT